MRDVAWIIAKGMAMGVAEAIPGISGGTIALILGIYDRLIEALSALHPRPLRHVMRFHQPAGRRQFREELVAMDVPFLLALLVGMVAMVILLARAIEGALVAYAGIIYAFFAGLIAASAVVLYRQVELDSAGRIALGIAGVVVAAVLTGFSTTGLGHGLPVLFLAGAIAMTALVLPGVSGSFLLLALGQYAFMLTTVNGFVDALGGTLRGTVGTDQLVATSTPVVSFLAGAIVGLLTVAHAVKMALDRARQATLILLVSLMVGSLRVPGERVLAAAVPDVVWTVTVLVSAALGIAVIIAFDRVTGELEY